MVISKKLTILRWFDVAVLTLILFGEGIVNSTLQFLALQQHTTTVQENLTFSRLDNYKALAIQLIWLILAILYLLFRNFDFSIWKKRIFFTKWVPLQVVGLFLVTALCMDAFHLISYQFVQPLAPSMFQWVPGVDISLILYALLNGFYEEIFFLGVCLTVNPNYTKWVFLYSLIIRCSFHTYQGLAAGVGLGLIVGPLFYYFYRKLKPENMLPFFLAHAIADVIGLTVLSYVLY
ncbi:abortive infection protein [Streptococcus acidominimus]|uniref:Abortive infection protein n=1 Tax=Streptococcus acidominimus TaxID=1326 RepID=A0A239WFM2_STRAI|nr:CPBP family glutamic-type intramembrane protease [Streptococcus acidominimus]SNV32723.1 abortive infection protein [Streptococcus acidominimus]